MSNNCEYLIKIYKERDEAVHSQPEVKECFTVWGDEVFEVIQERKDEKVAVFVVGKPVIDFT